MLSVALSSWGARDTIGEALARADRDGEEWCVPDRLCSKGEFVQGRPF
jgi:hypothetical protein